MIEAGVTIIPAITETHLRRVLGEAISLWCDDDVTPLTRLHLTEEIFRKLHEVDTASCSG